MGCSASKKSVGESKSYPAVKTIEVASNEEDNKSAIGQLNAEDGTVKSNKEKSTGSNVAVTESPKAEENNNGRDDVEDDTSIPQQFVKREENKEGADKDVTTLNEIIVNSISNNINGIIRILGSVSYEHRQLVRSKYQEKFNKDLLDEIILTEEKDIEMGLKSLVRNHAEFLSFFMHHSIKRSDFRALVEILMAWPSELLAQAKEKYKEDRRVDFLEDVTNSIGEKLSEEQKSMIISLASLERSEDSGELDESALNDECEQLSEGATSIIDVLATKPCSRTQLKSIFDQFKLKYYMDITESIDIEIQDEFTETVLKTIVGIASDTPLYFATLLHEILTSPQVSIDRLLFIVIGRQFVDLADIMKRYEEVSTRPFVNAIAQSKEHVKDPIRDLLLLVTERSNTA